MERKLELRDIAGYIPYGLFVSDDTEIRPVRISVVNIENIIDSCKCKPILRPVSDLYKTIVHNGKEIVPIVECAKIALGNDDWMCSEGGAAYVEHEGCDEYSTGIRYDEDYDTFIYFDNETDDSSCPHLYRLFDYMNELKIDYRGLIDAGLAVSIYDVENPYK